MELQNLNRWQWAVIGLLLGLAMAYAYIPHDRPANRVSVSPAEFQRDLLRVERRAEGDPPVIRNVVLYPPIDGEYYATFERIDLGKRAYKSCVIDDRHPWQVLNPNGTNLRRGEDLPDLPTYLEKVREANPDFSYSYAWWSEPRFAYPTWAAAGVLVVGGVWPTIINLMIGAGFAPPRKPKERKIKLTPSREPEPAGAAKAPVDEAEIAAVAAAYEQNLAAHASESGPAAAGDTPTETPVRKLDGGPAEPVPVMHQPEDDEPKEYVGEFYPVAKAAPKKD